MLVAVEAPTAAFWGQVAQARFGSLTPGVHLRLVGRLGVESRPQLAAGRVQTSIFSDVGLKNRSGQGL